MKCKKIAKIPDYAADEALMGMYFIINNNIYV